MQPLRSIQRAESPPHQQLYKRGASPSNTRRRSPVTPHRSGLALAVVPPGTSPRRASNARGGGANAATPGAASGDSMVYVADVNPVYSITAAVRCFVPINDRVMWSGDYNGTLCVRALPKATPLRRLPGREGTCCISLLHVPEEGTVWAGFQDGYLHVYEARTMELMKEVMAHGGGLSCMTLADDSVFTGGADWKVCQWSVHGVNDGPAELLRTLHGHRGGVRCLGVYDGPTGCVVFSGSDDGTVRAWDPYIAIGASAGDSANIHTFTGHERAVLSLVVIPHVNQLWSGGEDMTVRVWDMQTLECVAVLRSGNTAPIANLMVVESRVWSADKHGHILLWDITTRSLLQDVSDRVPYWGMGQGMIHAMQKVQPTTAYKVWTASSNGVLQCWNAETIPIVFDDFPVAAGVQRPAAPAAITAVHTDSAAPASDSAAGSPNPRSAALDTTDFSALTVSTQHNSSTRGDAYNCGGGTSPAQATAAASMQDFARYLQEELQATQRDARTNYEKYRLEVQLEIETQQLLAQENARLRDRVQELEEGGHGGGGEGVRADPPPAPQAAITQLPAGSVRSARRTDAHTTPSVAVVEAWTAENDELRRQLDVALQELDEAREQQQKLQAQLLAATAVVSPSRRSGSGGAGSSEEPSPEIELGNRVADPSRQFVRQDGMTKLPSVTADNASSVGGGDYGGAFSAVLSSPRDAQWGHEAVTRSSLTRHLPGDSWDYLVNEKPFELHSTLTADLCAGLGVAPTQLERVNLEDDGRKVELDVVHPVAISRAEMQRRLQAYPFPGVARMHADAHSTTKTGPDTSEATILDLREQLAKTERELAAALEEQARHVEPSPEPQQPFSNMHPSYAIAPANAAEEAAKAAAAAAAATAEQARLNEANTALRDTVEDQQRTIHQLQDALEDQQRQLTSTRKELEKAENDLEIARQQQQQQQEESLQQTPPARGVRDSRESAEMCSPKPHDSAAPPRVDGTVRKMAGSESGRPTELVAMPLGEEMAAAAAAPTSPATDADAQERIAALQHLLNEATEKLEAVQLANTEAAHEIATLDAAVEGEKERSAELEQRLRAERQKLAAAAAASPTALAKQASSSQASARADSSEENVLQLREDYDALNDYLHEQLKPMIGRLKRARGELQYDKTLLLRQLEEAQKAAAQSAESPRAVEAAAPTESEAAAAKTEATGDAQLREDYDALNSYLHDQLKPLIARLKRARGELQYDLARAQEDLQRVYSLYDDAQAALDEAHVREEKMGETMEALQKALEVEQQKNHAAAVSGATTPTAGEPAAHTRLQSEASAGRPTQAAQLGSTTDDADIAEPPQDAAKGGASADASSPPQGDESKLHDTIDRLAAQNLNLSVRLADAGNVIAQLHDSLGQSSAQLTQQCGEAQRLLEMIDTYQQGARSHSDNVLSVSTSESLP